MQAITMLMDELKIGKISGEKECNYSAEEVREHFKEKGYKG